MMKDLDRDEIFERLGLRRSQDGWLWGLAGLGVGALLGAVGALLLAPKSGRELREQVFQRGRALGEQGRELVDRAGDRAGEAPRAPR